MTVSISSPRAQYQANGVTTAFDAPFLFYAQDRLKVWVTTAQGVTTLKTLGTDYTVSGAGSPSGGTVTFLAAPAFGSRVTIMRVVPLSQSLDLVNNSSFDADLLERALDEQTMGMQQLQEQIDRAVITDLVSETGPQELLNSIFAAQESAAESAGTASAVLDEIKAIPSRYYEEATTGSKSTFSLSWEFDTRNKPLEIFVNGVALAKSAFTCMPYLYPPEDPPANPYLGATVSLLTPVSAGTIVVIRSEAGTISDLNSSPTPAANTVPLSGDNGTLAAGWIPKASAAEVAAGAESAKFITPVDSIALRGHGECRMTLSGGNLLLSRVGLGRMLNANGLMYQVPAAGLTLSPAGLTPSANYFIYLDTVNGVLEASATAHTTDSATGIEIKSGDKTKVLVGMVRIITGPAFSDTSNGRFVLSWFNRRDLSSIAPLAAIRSTTSTSFANLAAVSSEYAYFLCWGDELVKIGSSASGYATVAPNAVWAGIMVDGAAVNGAAVVTNCTGLGNYYNFSIPTLPVALAEGYHYVSLAAKTVTGTTANMLGDAADPARSTVRAMIRG